MAYDEVLADRVREKLRTCLGVAEKRMFGGIAFLTHGNMTLGVHGDELIARISPEHTDAALAEPGCTVFDITGKPMRGWILVTGEHLDNSDLDRWLAGQDVRGDSHAEVASLARTSTRFSVGGVVAIRFLGNVRRWRDDSPGGLTVVDVPAELVEKLAGRRQMRVTGTCNGADFTGSRMLVSGGGVCVGVSKAALKAAGASLGDQVELSIEPVART